VAAGEYDAVRPEWPPATLEWLLGSPPAGTSLQVLDLGAGTGKGTRTLAALGHAVVAVEPSAGMRARLQESLSALPTWVATRVDVRAGDAERLPLPDRSVDAVVALQTWHWFDQQAAERECARVLRPGGELGLAWHHREESLPWASELSRVVRRSESEGEDLESPVLSTAFGPPETTLLRFVLRQSVEDLVRHAATWSFVAVSSDREQILQKVREVARQAAGPDGLVEIPMTTSCYRARRRYDPAESG